MMNIDYLVKRNFKERIINFRLVTTAISSTKLMVAILTKVIVKVLHNRLLRFSICKNVLL